MCRKKKLYKRQKYCQQKKEKNVSHNLGSSIQQEPGVTATRIGNVVVTKHALLCIVYEYMYGWHYYIGYMNIFKCALYTVVCIVYMIEFISAGQQKFTTK